MATGTLDALGVGHSSCSCRSTDCSVGSALPALLVEQASLRQADLDAHPVRSNMKQLLRALDQLSPFEPGGGLARPDYVRSFLDYINTLAAVVVRSLGSEGRNPPFFQTSVLFGRIG